MKKNVYFQPSNVSKETRQDEGQSSKSQIRSVGEFDRTQASSCSLKLNITIRLQQDSHFSCCSPNSLIFGQDGPIVILKYYWTNDVKYKHLHSSPRPATPPHTNFRQLKKCELTLRRARWCWHDRKAAVALLCSSACGLFPIWFPHLSRYLRSVLPKLSL